MNNAAKCLGYQINIIKIFVQASLLSRHERLNKIIPNRQLPNIGKTMFNQAPDPVGTTSKDSSSINTPTFGGSHNNSQVDEKETSAVPEIKKPNESKDDYKLLIDQISGDLADKILSAIHYPRLCAKLLNVLISVICKDQDVNHKDIISLVETTLDLLLPCIICQPFES